MLVRLVYYSVATRDMSLLDIQSILEVARAHNRSINVCGMLCYEQKYFLQVLEGDREDVNELYLEIADDPRHDQVVIISYDVITAPLFPDWNMGFAPASDHFYRLLNELGKNEFLPQDFTAEQALSFLKGLSDYQ